MATMEERMEQVRHLQENLPPLPDEFTERLEEDIRAIHRDNMLHAQLAQDRMLAQDERDAEAFAAALTPAEDVTEEEDFWLENELFADDVADVTMDQLPLRNLRLNTVIDPFSNVPDIPLERLTPHNTRFNPNDDPFSAIGRGAHNEFQRLARRIEPPGRDSHFASCKRTMFTGTIEQADGGLCFSDGPEEGYRYIAKAFEHYIMEFAPYICEDPRYGNYLSFRKKLTTYLSTQGWANVYDYRHAIVILVDALREVPHNTMTKPEGIVFFREVMARALEVELPKVHEDSKYTSMYRTEASPRTVPSTTHRVVDVFGHNWSTSSTATTSTSNVTWIPGQTFVVTGA